MPRLSNNAVQAEYGIQESTAQVESAGGTFVQNNQVQYEDAHHEHVIKYYWYKYCCHGDARPYELLKPKEKDILAAELAGLHNTYRFQNQSERRHVVSAWHPKINEYFADKQKARNLYKPEHRPSWWPGHIEYCSATNNKKTGDGRHTSEELDTILKCMRTAFQHKLINEIAQLSQEKQHQLQASSLPQEPLQDVTRKLKHVDVSAAMCVKQEIKEEELSKSYQDSQPYTQAEFVAPGQQVGIHIKQEMIDPTEINLEELSKDNIPTRFIDGLGQVEALSCCSQGFQPPSPSHSIPTVVSDMDESGSLAVDIAKSAMQNPQLIIPPEAMDQLTELLSKRKHDPLSREILNHIDFRQPENNTATEQDKVGDFFKDEDFSDSDIKNPQMLDPSTPIFAPRVSQQGSDETDQDMEMEDTQAENKLPPGWHVEQNSGPFLSTQMAFENVPVMNNQAPGQTPSPNLEMYTTAWGVSDANMDYNTNTFGFGLTIETHANNIYAPMSTQDPDISVGTLDFTDLYEYAMALDI